MFVYCRARSYHRSNVKIITIYFKTQIKMDLPKIIFNASKNELFKLGENYKTLHRKIKSAYKVEM